MTGASRGIGRATALELSEAGWPTILWARSEDALRAVAEAATGPTPLCQRVDLADPASVRSAVKELAQRDIKLQGLVLNAGAGRWRPIHEQTYEEWRATQASNVDGHYLTLQLLLPFLEGVVGAFLVGVLSDSALYPFAERTAYAASKAAFRMLLESIRQEIRHSGVRVSLLFPARVDTYFQGSMIDAHPGGRPGSLEPSDVAAAVSYIVSQPPGVEIREIHLGAMSASYGPYPQQVEACVI